jgi:hypothetical protein
MSTKLDKQVKRLLRSPAARASLKRQFGIDVEVVPEQPKDKPVVAILCPTYRAPEPEMKQALQMMCQATNESGKATVYVGPPCASSVVHWSRNWLVGEHIKSGKPWTHVLFIDDDIVVEPEALLKLLAHKKDLVAGLCTRRNDPPIPNIRFYNKEDGTTRQIWEWPENQLVEVDAVGTGLMLISQHAMEQVAQVYFDCLWERDFYGMTDDRVEKVKAARLKKFDSEKICYWFRFLPTTMGDIEMGEDVTFCWMAKNYCGIPVFVDTSVQPGHLGPYPFGIKDFVPYRDLCIERAKREGTYKTQPKMEAEIQLVG